MSELSDEKFLGGKDVKTITPQRISPIDVNRLQLILDRVDTHSEYGNAKFASMGDFEDFREIVQSAYARTFHAKYLAPAKEDR